ncbi:MAG: hypothetical protein AAB225_12035 [Acidobacteriota bacterium]
MSADTKGRVVNVQLPNSMNGPHGTINAGDKVCKGTRAAQRGLSELARRSLKDERGNSPLVIPSFAIRPSRKPRLSNRSREVRHLAEEPELLGSAWLMLLHVVLDDGTN